MYLLYEHHKQAADSGANSQILATDMLMTSFFPGSPAINFRKLEEKVLFELTKGMFKEVHIAKRSYDPESKVWSFFPPAGAELYEKLKASPLAQAGRLQFERVEDLIEQKISGFIQRPAKAWIDPADFFYQPEASQSTSLSRSEILKRLAPLLQLTEPELDVMFTLPMLKKPYRQAALRLHPDRPENQGKGDQMSELNWLFEQWKPFAATE